MNTKQTKIQNCEEIHIQEMILDGYNQGELNDYDHYNNEEIRGWWKISKINQMNPFRCEICGKFISYDELNSGKARHEMVTPESVYTNETWSTYHVDKCTEKVYACNSKETK